MTTGIRSIASLLIVFGIAACGGGGAATGGAQCRSPKRRIECRRPG